MEGGRSSGILLLLAMVMVAMPACMAYDLYVGGRDGWGPNPAVGFNQWAQAVRFRINDRLVFRSKSGNDSVLVVKKEDYEACNVSNPIKKIDGGESAAFRLDRSGPFFFISGVPGGCQQGQKLHIVVLSPKNGLKTPVPSSAPVPSVARPPLASTLTPTSTPLPAPGPSIAETPMAASSPVSESPTGDELPPSPSPALGEDGHQLAPAPSPASGEDGHKPESAGSFVSVSGALVAVAAMVVGGALFA